MPVRALFELVSEVRLSDPAVSSNQEDQTLADEKPSGFLRHFLGRWLQLDLVNATTPVAKLDADFMITDRRKRVLVSDTFT
jgi:hypothetical protein